tara:strand:- start:263 stop:388 length:126 start_codon:yes stop_codon:yes gene_type:complete
MEKPTKILSKPATDNLRPVGQESLPITLTEKRNPQTSKHTK